MSATTAQEARSKSDDAASSDASDTESVASTSSNLSLPAPLSGLVAEPSIDATSIAASEEGNAVAKKAEDVPAEDLEEAKNAKSKGNEMFKESKYQEATDFYTLSLRLNPFDSTVWCNRAACRLKREEHGLAIADATRAIELDARYVKAYFRRALANLAILEPKRALVDFKKCVKFEPGNAPAKTQLDSTQKLVRKMDFEKAIRVEDEEPIAVQCRKQLDEGNETIDSSYRGPRLEQDDKGKSKMTEGFIKEMIEWFKQGKTLPRRIVWEIVIGAREHLLKEPSLSEVVIPEGETADIIGDTHGQFYDFLHLLSLTGTPSPTHALVFNGDFVDRGSWSSEVAIVLFSYKWLYPTKTILNRGNHETQAMNSIYGFEGEATKKYSKLTYRLFEEAFIALPISSLVSASAPPRAVPKTKQHSGLPINPILSPKGHKRFFITHGGLFSKDGVTLEDIKNIPRFRLRQPGNDGIMCECLWADPQFLPGRGPSKRGVGLGFGPDITKRWCEDQGVTALIRSHEVRQEGFSVEHSGLCITVFSAPNYVDQVGNLAAFARIDETGEIDFRTFAASPHPENVRPMMYAGGFGAGGML